MADQIQELSKRLDGIAEVVNGLAGAGSAGQGGVSYADLDAVERKIDAVKSEIAGITTKVMQQAAQAATKEASARQAKFQRDLEETLQPIVNFIAEVERDYKSAVKKVEADTASKLASSVDAAAQIKALTQAQATVASEAIKSFLKEQLS